MSLNSDILFQPLGVGPVTLKNRIVMAPMTRSFAVDGKVGDAHSAYYGARADGGVGLILTEGVAIDRPAARNDPGVPTFHGPAVDDWRAVVDRAHEGGAAIAPQIWHVGAVRSLTTDWEPEASPESPSGLFAPDQPRGTPMSDEAITDSIAAFARAAADSRRVGFDMVELHGAHGYLVDQFFWNGTNGRSDGYGGATLKQRSRYAAEVIAAMRQAVGPDFPIILRVSQWKQQDLKARLAETPQAMAQWLTPLVEAGADILHCSQRRFWTPEFPEMDGEDGLNFAGWAKKLTGATTISVGSVGLAGDFINAFRDDQAAPARIDRLIRRIEREEFDLIAVGRALITEPDWPAKVREGHFDAMLPFSKSALGTFV